MANPQQPFRMILVFWNIAIFMILSCLLFPIPSAFSSQENLKATVMDSQGIETQIVNPRVHYAQSFRFEGPRQNLTVTFNGGYLEIPLKTIEKIARPNLPKSREESSSEIMIDLWIGQTVEGSIQRPHSSIGPFIGSWAGTTFKIHFQKIQTITFAPQIKAEGSATKVGDHKGLPRMTIRTKTGVEVVLTSPHSVWLGNGCTEKSQLSDEWFSLYRGDAELKIFLNEVRAIRVTEKDKSKVVAVQMKDGTKIEGKHRHGWSLAGQMELGCFLVPLDELVSATFSSE